MAGTVTETASTAFLTMDITLIVGIAERSISTGVSSKEIRGRKFLKDDEHGKLNCLSLLNYTPPHVTLLHKYTILPNKAENCWISF